MVTSSTPGLPPRLLLRRLLLQRLLQLLHSTQSCPARRQVRPGTTKTTQWTLNASPS